MVKVVLSTLLTAFATTAASEIGDRSFITATLLALRFPKITVFLATTAALLVQSFSSTLAGSLLGQFLSNYNQTYHLANWLAVALFAIFALQHALEARNCYRAPNQAKSRLQEDPALTVDLIETTTSPSTNLADDADSRSRDYPPTTALSIDDNDNDNDNTQLITPWWRTFWRVFTLIYVAEAGDTSMIVTVTLASGHNPILVFLGANLANVLVNGVGIWAGAATSKHLSDFTINLAASLLFITFSFSSLLAICTQ